MRTHKSYLAALAMCLTGSMLVGCVLTAASTQPIPTAPPTLTPTATEEPAQAGAVAGDITIEIAPSEPDLLQATLIANVGRVEVRRSWETSYTPLLKNQAVLVGTGDAIRTGSDGAAQLIFMDNTETMVFPNTVLVIESFAQGTDETCDICIMQFIGTTFNRVNLPDSNTLYEIATPFGTTSVRGTSFWVHVSITDTYTTMLLTQELEAMLGDIGQTVASGDLIALAQIILDLLATTPGTVEVDVGVGQVTLTDQDGNTATVSSGFIASAGTDSEGNTIVLTTGVTDRFCGDGICDSYLDETAATCPDDC